MAVIDLRAVLGGDRAHRRDPCVSALMMARRPRGPRRSWSPGAVAQRSVAANLMPSRVLRHPGFHGLPPRPGRAALGGRGLVAGGQRGLRPHGFAAALAVGAGLRRRVRGGRADLLVQRPQVRTSRRRRARRRVLAAGRRAVRPVVLLGEVRSPAFGAGGVVIALGIACGQFGARGYEQLQTWRTALPTPLAHGCDSCRAGIMAQGFPASSGVPSGSSAW